MLDEFLVKISDKAQLKIAIRMSKLALPIWEEYFAKNPNELENINNLIGEANRVQGGVKQIDVGFLERALNKIENSFSKASEKNENPIPLMKVDPLLSPLFATSMQPITNSQWDTTLTQSVRLVYTSVWNILTWLIFKRNNEVNETHIYIAINQAADALTRENFMTFEQINDLLLEYNTELRNEGEDEAWENAVREKEGDYDINDIYKKIIGEKIIKDAPNLEQTKEILRQMKEEGKSFWDKWEEYYSATCNTYSFNKEENSFYFEEVDVLVGSFYNKYLWSEKEMMNFISGVSLHDLRESGFEI